MKRMALHFSVPWSDLIAVTGWPSNRIRTRTDPFGESDNSNTVIKQRRTTTPSILNNLIKNLFSFIAPPLPKVLISRNGNVKSP